MDAKFGWDSLTKAQRVKLDEDIDFYALMEAYHIECETPLNFEARIRKVIEACIEPSVLDEASRLFRQRIMAHRAAGIKCAESEETRKIVKDLKGLATRAIERANKQCQNCFFC
ncbi:MAG: hypothetical protein ACT4N2_12100 [Hyphomicrobium sp.]